MADTVTIPGAAVGRNCHLSANGFGSRNVRVVNVGKGFTVQGSTDDSARSQAFYPMGRSMTDFTVTFIFASEDERNTFSNWLKKYGTWTSSRGVFMKVSIPGKNYVQYGIPYQGITFAGTIGVVAPTMAVVFTAALDPNDPADRIADLNRIESTVVLPSGQATVGATFYPSGNQVAGPVPIDQSVYGTTGNGNTPPKPPPGAPPTRPITKD